MASLLFPGSGSTNVTTVTSHNQTGGVTAGHIGSVDQRPIPPSRKKNPLKMILALVGLVAALAGILGYVDYKPWKSSTSAHVQKRS